MISQLELTQFIDACSVSRIDPIHHLGFLLYSHEIVLTLSLSLCIEVKFSQTRRQKIKEENPDMQNTDISRLLGEMWRNASQQERAPYVDQELRERAVYKEKMRQFREKQAREDAASRTSHQSVHSYHHHSQSYERSYPPPPTVSNAFENLHVDSFDDVNKAGYNPKANHSYLQPFQSTGNLSRAVLC